ncbi:hypothetical protein BDQ12DRAFT_489182 [Crucibulum laeve]|uniref:Senescence domain-containing protein n=1 Tax=Crucibulum laeve TaxID=68775 RepID=A0A5C3M761_9AGAR|nr:hypothetical protein BDQ12DRAFT_489182 [Crucibulum laeve]
MVRHKRRKALRRGRSKRNKGRTVTDVTKGCTDLLSGFVFASLTPPNRNLVFAEYYIIPRCSIVPHLLFFHLTTMVSTTTEAFQLLSLPSASLNAPGVSEKGLLSLECVTIPAQEGGGIHDRDVYLVLRLNMSETPIDPARTIQRSDDNGRRIYAFYPTPNDPFELVLTITLPSNGSDPQLLEDIDTFESILGQYADLRGSPHSGGNVSSSPVVGVEQNSGEKDLRGHLVMINEDTGEVLGEVEDRFRIREDPGMHQQGHESDPVVIEVPDEQGLAESDANAMEVFATLVPPDQQDWITKSATVVSHAISMTTNLLLTTITTASSYYINKSAPSQQHPVNGGAATSTAKGTNGATGNGAPPPLPPRALVFLTSERTRKGLHQVHAVSGKAVQVSAKTVSVIDNMIRRAMGAKAKRPRTQFVPSVVAGRGTGVSAGMSEYDTSKSAFLSGMPQVTRSPSPGATSSLSPPPYAVHARAPETLGEKPALPPRRSPSPSSWHSAPPLPLRGGETNKGRGLSPTDILHPPQPKLTKKDRVLISADLILSTIDDSTRKILDTGTESLGKVMGHKYGPEAAQSSVLMAGTARNVGLVYIDMRGIGRRALLKRAGRTWVKAKVSSNKADQTKADQTQAQRQQASIQGQPQASGQVGKR